MKHSLFLCCLLFSSPLRADSLTQADLEELRERLKLIQEGANEHVDKRFKIAMDDFRAALGSEEQAVELYLRCVEKVDFTSQKKKVSDFREWKRNNEGRLKLPEYRQALRHQLNWLSLTMRAAARPAEVNKLSGEAMEALNAMFANAKILGPQRGLLSAPVTDTVFIKAYELGELKLKNWPTSPMQVSAVFDQVIMPPLRKPDKIAALAEAWDTRIKMEAAKVELFSGDAPQENALARGDKRTPAMIAFTEETLPDLRWRKEADLYRSGDQRAAALRMLAHIKENLTHAKASDWIEQFQALINPEKAEAAK